ncbi:hypothetical protein [Micromonospora robiginosa]|uniref:Beta-lactamase n=1 Tax=Micromonospora robiginosa TaxID=2749844 RepID=A0A7L6B990_9ACTN|nr:hypothetical protein [Micromonospora ferruginea]QLQ38418.1 hypothetical protein H1D33_06055 [Micromonospora ferruginea]
MGLDPTAGVSRRRLVEWGGLAAAGAVAAGVPLAGAGPAAAAARAPRPGRIPPATRPGGAYDRYVAGLAAAGRFSGVMLLSHRGRTVLSRSYGMADRERGIVGGQWVIQRAGGNPGVCANWTNYPDTGWVGVILANGDDAPLVEMIARETQAVTGATPDGGSGG